MNSFGLGLVLNFVDNASSGMSNATRAFQQMSGVADAVSSSVSTSISDIVMASYALNSVGSVLQNTGMSIVDLYSKVSNSVIQSGMTMQGYRMQLTALYGSAEAGMSKLEDIKDYAAKSVFEMESLIPAVTMMKAVGIEAMQDITTSSGLHTQKLLDYASDIAAMVPNMHNAYGTGVSAAMGALKEYIAEGNALSLKRGAGFDITGILGQDKGKTIEERTQQIADLVEQLNIVGYTTSLAGTPTQQLSNLQDVLFNTLTKIADSGVFDKYSSLLSKLSNWIFTTVNNEETFNTITGVLSDTITSLLSPLDNLLDLLIENGNKIVEWIENNPKLAKNILLTVAAVGGLLVAMGTLFKLMSTFGMAGVGFQYIRKLPAFIHAITSSFGKLIPKILLATAKMAPFLAVAGLAYYAWKENIFGIRDTITKFVSDVGTIFSLVGDAWKDGAMSEENFLKAKELGILPFIEGLLQMKYYWDFVVEGFKKGFKSFFEGLAESLSGLKAYGIDVNAIVASMGDFLKSLFEVGAEDKWTAIGEAVGKISGAMITLLAVVGVLKPIFKIVLGISKVLIAIGNSKVVRGVVKVVKTLVKWLIKAGSVLKSFFGNLGAAISLIREGNSVFSVLGAWFPRVAGFFSKLKSGLALIWKGITTAVSAIAVALGVPAWVVGAIIAAIVALVSLIVTYWDEIKAWCIEAGQWLYHNLIVPVKNFFIDLFNVIVGLGAVLWEGLKIIGTFLYDYLIKPIWEGIQWLWNKIVEIVEGIATFIYDYLISPIITMFNFLWDVIAGVADGIWNAIVGTARWIYDSIVDIFDDVVAFFENVVPEPIKKAFQGLGEAIVSVFRWVKDTVMWLWDQVSGFFSWAWDGLKSIGEGITGITSGVSETVAEASPDTVVFTPGIPAAAKGVENFVGGLIQVNEEGGELINLPTGSTVIPHDQSIKDSLIDGIELGVMSMSSTLKNFLKTPFNTPEKESRPIKSVVDSTPQNLVYNTYLNTNRTIETTIKSPESEGSVQEVNPNTDKLIRELTGSIETLPTALVPGVSVSVEPHNPEDSGINTSPDKSEESFLSKIRDSLSSLAMYSGSPTQTSNQVSQNDYSVTFSAGSVVIQLSNASESELEKAAEKLMKIIERKQRLKQMATRTSNAF